MTWRTEDELMARVRRSAVASKRSMNAYVTAVMDAATNPDLEDDEAVRLRDRLSIAGLLIDLDDGPRRLRPPRERVEAARRAAGRGKSLADILGDDRS